MIKRGLNGKGCEWSKLWDCVKVSMRWAEYLEQVLNVADVRKGNVNGNWRTPVLGEMNESNIDRGSKRGSE